MTAFRGEGPCPHQIWQKQLKPNFWRLLGRLLAILTHRQLTLRIDNTTGCEPSLNLAESAHSLADLPWIPSGDVFFGGLVHPQHVRSSLPGPRESEKEERLKAYAR